ncbi:hypothetical protein [Halobacterium litoreum]|uniref:Uncharacterized protein n=1 Tax=Halobacterium litoreum TaxID=2039234 RepID=A0ABD5NF52_9EURY|nr:hypothetical protein [Halobacterium litoreum]UHH13410.1 hypothetical protein LT972_00080 [Halobacterium litoreum]
MSELRVDSRWWYWVAAVPVVTAFWLVSALWVAAVVLLVPEAAATSMNAVVSIPAVALGVPAVVVFLLLPLALLQDSRAVERAGGDWSELGARAPQIAGALDLVLLAGVYQFFEGNESVLRPDPLGTLLIGVAVVAGTWLCVRYLRERKSLVAMPGSLREWRTELRPEEQLR